MKFKFYFGFFIIATFLLLFTSCSPRIHNKSTKEIIIYPPPPDTARIQYLTRISSSQDIARKQSAFATSVVGKKQVMPIRKPYGIFMRNGKLYVCDVSIGGLEIIDFETKEFNYFVPTGPYQLKLPINCYVDTNDQLYVADVNLQKIAIFDSIGKYITSFGKKENIKPTDVFVYENKIYVPDSGNNRVNVYKEDTHEFEFYFPKSEKGDDSFLYKPTNIFVLKGKIYVSDMGNGTVKIFTHKGEYLSTVGKYGKNIGELVRPKGIAVDREENLYVVDASFENVQIFNKDGELLLFFGGSYKGPGDMWLPTKVIIDYDNLKYFEKYVDPKFKLEYLIFVANQFGPDKISVYGRIVPVKGKLENSKE
ncbi:MAG: 6-bladed beta-propeller [Flavobacteriaceae bacterium]|nr:6-bladed beta-propeller [Flavobacteriaceae bacterium]